MPGQVEKWTISTDDADWYNNRTKNLKDILDSDAWLKQVDPRHSKPVHDDPDAAKLIAEHGIDIAKYVELPLHCVIDDSKMEVFEILLSTRYSNICHRDEKVHAALCYAVSCNNFKAVDLLLDSGARVKHARHPNISPLHYVGYKDESAEVTRCIRTLLSHGASGDSVMNGTSALSQAAISDCGSEYTKRLKLFFEYGAGQKCDGSAFNLRAFRVVIKRGNLDDLKLFFKYGIDPAIYERQFPLHVAVEAAQLEILKYLLSTNHFDPNQTDDKGWPALFEAVSEKNPEAAEILLKFGAEVNFVYTSLIDREYWTPLRLVKWRDKSDETTKIIEILLRYGADADRENEHGQTPLYLASKLDSYGGPIEYCPVYTDRLKLFFKYRIGDYKLGNLEKEPFEAIVEIGDMQAVQLFLDHGINLYECSIHFDNILQKAAANPHKEVFELLLGTGKFNPEWKNNSGLTILHETARAANHEAVQLLLDWGVDVDSISDSGETALSIAAKMELSGGKGKDAYAKCIELLLNHGANILLECSGKSWIEEMFSRSSWYPNARIWPENVTASVTQMLFIRHASLLKSQGHCLDSTPFIEWEGDLEMCQNELEALKSEVFGGSVTLYDVLVYQNLLTKGSEVLQKLQSPEYVHTLENRFPIYGNRLVEIIEYMTPREAAAEKLSQLMGLKRDTFYMIIDKIVKMLPKRSVRALLEVEVESQTRTALFLTNLFTLLSSSQRVLHGCGSLIWTKLWELSRFGEK